MLGLVAIGGAVVALRLEQPETLSAINRLSLPVQVTIVVTAVVTEEILWRGYPIERLTELTGNILNIVGVAFVPTWIYNETGSVLLAILAHTGFNTANSTLVPLPLETISAGDSTTILVVTTVVLWVVVAVLFVATRGQFGYETEPGAATTPTPDHGSEAR